MGYGGVVGEWKVGSGTLNALYQVDLVDNGFLRKERDYERIH